MGTKKCPQCGAEIDENATRCYNCQHWMTEAEGVVCESKPQDFLSTALFAWFLGCFGIHRFWTGHIAIGVAQLLTLGGCGIWSIIDLILICFNKFRDAQGRELRNYDRSIGIILFVIMLIPLLILLFLITFIAGLVLLGSTTN